MVRVVCGSREITEGVRTSTRAVKAAEDGIKRMKSYAQTKTVGEWYHRQSQYCYVCTAKGTVARIWRPEVGGPRQDSLQQRYHCQGFAVLGLWFK